MTDKKNDDLEWLQYQEVDQANSFTSQLFRNPLVPIGTVLTTVCLGVGLKSLVSGDKVLSQKMMRARVGAQGFTLVALVAGLFYHATSS